MLDLKKPALIRAMQKGQVIPQSLAVSVCGDYIVFFYPNTEMGFLLDSYGRRKAFKSPRREIEKIRDKAGV